MQDLVMERVIPNFIKSLFITLIGIIISVFFLGDAISSMASFLALIMLIVTFIFKFISMRRRGEYSHYGIRIPMWFVYVFALLTGIGITPLLKYYMSNMGLVLVMLCVGLTVLIFVSLFMYAKVSKKDFSYLGFFLFIGLIVIIILGIANIFLKFDILTIALSMAGILIFSGYILYDVSNMVNRPFTEEDVPMAVLDLYIDFINLLLDILRLVSKIRDLID